MKKIITFDNSLREEILSLLNKKMDEEGYIVEEDNPEQRVITPDGEEVHIDEFAGVTKGSEVFIKSNLPSLIEFSKRSPK